MYDPLLVVQNAKGIPNKRPPDNVASENQSLGSSIVLSDETLLGMKDANRFRHRFIDKVRIKGREDAITVYEVFEGEAEALVELKEQSKPAFKIGLQLYYGKRFSEARLHFNQLLEKNPSDLAARIYLKRSANCMVNGVPSEWTGVESLSEK